MALTYAFDEVTAASASLRCSSKQREIHECVRCTSKKTKTKHKNYQLQIWLRSCVSFPFFYPERKVSEADSVWEIGCWVSTRLILTFIGVTTAASTVTEFTGQRFVTRLCTRQACTRPTDGRTGVSLTNPIDPDLDVRVVRSMYTGLSRRSRFFVLFCFLIGGFNLIKKKNPRFLLLYYVYFCA